MRTSVMELQGSDQWALSFMQSAFVLCAVLIHKYISQHSLSLPHSHSWLLGHFVYLFGPKSLFRFLIFAILLLFILIK